MSLDSFKATLYGMFENQQNCDVIFSCNDPTSKTGKSCIMAHKLVLSLTSDVFSTMFFGEAAKNRSVSNEMECWNPVHVDDVQMATFKLFLSFVYTKLVNFETPEVAADFYYAAHKYNSVDALKFITDYMLQEMSSENVISFYEVACLYENNQLKEACVKMFSEKTVDVINSQSFLTADPQTIETIYKLNELHITSEEQLIHALERYIAHNQGDDCDIAKKVRPALSHIRFLALSAPLIIQTKLLDPADTLAVIGCLSFNQPVSTMPSFLSSNVQSRSSMRVVSTSKLEMMRKLSGVYFSSFCLYCKTFHPVWECDCYYNKFSSASRTTLKNVYEKYNHIFLYDYDANDLATVYGIYREIYEWTE